MSNYAVKVKQSPGWNKNPVGMISISQGQEAHEGAKLDALLQWGIDNHHTCLLNISDTLHRHNLIRMGIAPDDAMQAAYRLGNEWMQRNADILNRHKHKMHRIHRWNDWLTHPQFESVHAMVLAHYDHAPTFRAAALADIEKFIGRKKGHGVDVEYDRLHKSSHIYLLEETAAYIIMARTYAANRVYPAKPLLTFEYLRHTPDLPPLLRGMEKAMCVRVLFKRLSPQTEARSAA
ncbi:MAG: tRNA-dependent cyclodipeptide synthase [Alphaproteobacteria bacterium]|nr:tRNA-dependent cyclodipeptide synthase [Alphaproteobacteria bacterium]MBU0858731.1 tRNA-dependent cyclodipeptide synthase [Alphaproteobacteria bacterium]